MFGHVVPLYYFDDYTKKKSYCGAIITILLLLFGFGLTGALFEETYNPDLQDINQVEFDLNLKD